MKSKKFKKTVEDFECSHCGTFVKGDGYTDHCPNCLFSKHVDINPGDRLSECKGEMIPISVEVIEGRYKIAYKCSKCGYIHKVFSNSQDNFETILTIAKSNYTNLTS